MDGDGGSTIDHVSVGGVSLKMLLLGINWSCGSRDTTDDGEGTPSRVGHVAVERVRGFDWG